VRTPYEIFDAATGDSYGSRVSTSEAFDDARTIWVLAPGHYKVTINNEPFTTLEDFVSIPLAPGSAEELTIVVRTDEDGNPAELLGAGTLGVTPEVEEPGPLTLSSALNGSFSFSATNEEDVEDLQILYVLDAEVDSELRYQLDPIRYELENTLGLGLTSTAAGTLQVASDEFRLRNTFVYSLTPILGLYARADADLNLFPNERRFDAPRDLVRREDGEIRERLDRTSSIQTAPPFFPLEFREGAGVNVEALSSADVQVSVRGGFGASQTIREGVFAETEETLSIEETRYRVFEAQETQTNTGLELAAFAGFLLPLNTTLSTRADVFFPFETFLEPDLSWETTVNTILVNNISLYYRFILSTVETNHDGARLAQSHSLFVRLNYVFRL
jgi:hypothetical protein